jgi:hypothetical protein
LASQFPQINFVQYPGAATPTADALTDTGLTQ